MPHTPNAAKEATDPTNGKLHGSAVLKQAYLIRGQVFDSIQSLKNSPANTTQERIALAGAVRSLVQAWDTTNDRIRILHGRPLPGSRRPAPRERKQRQAKSGLVATAERSTENPVPDTKSIYNDRVVPAQQPATQPTPPVEPID